MKHHLTEEQMALLRGLVARAAEDERDRVARMKARPSGSHSRDKIRGAEKLARQLAELEAKLA